MRSHLYGPDLTLVSPRLKLFTLFLMRRALSISVLVVLLFAWTGALFATPACCPPPTSQTGQKADAMASAHASCHHAEAVPAAPDATLNAAPAKCTMACCGSFSLNKNFSLTRSAMSFHTTPAVRIAQAQQYLLALSGFSSITDRGPPAA